jgi:1-aminocyclopropane-1-carboxylate deaminase
MVTSRNIPEQPVALPWLERAGLSLSVLRSDLVDPLLSGNKYFKLKYNLAAATAEGKRTLLSFGGAWSNHLHALAAAGQKYGFATVGVIRGEAPAGLNACLQDVTDMGMQLHFLTRDEYRRKDGQQLHATLRDRYGDYYLIPEGGANLAGIQGCRELLAGIGTERYTHILLACGTGTTLTGLITTTSIPVIGIQVLKGEGYLQAAVARQLLEHGLQATAPWQLLDQFHGGGYARCNRELREFIADFSGQTGIPLEPVYTGKMLLALQELANRDFFPRNSRILALHSGGLQGKRGFRSI